MQISCEIYYMGKQLTLAENPLGGFPFSLLVARMRAMFLRYRIAKTKKESAETLLLSTIYKLQFRHH